MCTTQQHAFVGYTSYRGVYISFQLNIRDIGRKVRNIEKCRLNSSYLGEIGRIVGIIGFHSHSGTYSNICTSCNIYTNYWGLGYLVNLEVLSSFITQNIQEFLEYQKIQSFPRNIRKFREFVFFTWTHDILQNIQKFREFMKITSFQPTFKIFNFSEKCWKIIKLARNSFFFLA